MFFTAMRKLTKEINLFVRFVSLLEFHCNLICLERNLSIQEVFPASHFSLSPSGGRRLPPHNDRRIKSVSGGFFCELFATCCRWTIDWLPCGLRVVFFVTYQGREYQGDALGTVVDDPSGNAVLLHFLLYFLMQQKTAALARTRSPPIWRRYHLGNADKLFM